MQIFGSWEHMRLEMSVMTTKSNWALGTMGGFPPMGTIRKTTLDEISLQFLATNGQNVNDNIESVHLKIVKL